MGFLDELAKYQLEEEAKNSLISAYNDEVTPRDSKIETLKTANDAAASAIAERDKEITRVKALNWDATMGNPNFGTPEHIENPNAPKVSRSSKDLFDKFKTPTESKQ